MGEMSTGFTDLMISQRDVGGFPVFPVGGVWFNLEDPHFFLLYLMVFSYACWANFDFSSRPCVRLYLCSLMRTCFLIILWCKTSYLESLIFFF
jgi:hypothetical protein